MQNKIIDRMKNKFFLCQKLKTEEEIIDYLKGSNFYYLLSDKTRFEQLF